MGDGRGIDRPNDLESETRRIQAIEQGDPGAEQRGRQGDVELVANARLQVLPDGVGPSGDADVPRSRAECSLVLAPTCWRRSPSRPVWMRPKVGDEVVHGATQVIPVGPSPVGGGIRRVDRLGPGPDDPHDRRVGRERQ